MRISIQTLGTLGDVLPFLALGQHLQARGHDVSILSPRDHHRVITGYGLSPARPPGFSVADWMQEAEERGSLTGPRAFFRDWNEMIRPHVEDVLDCALEAGKDADLILANPIAMPARIAAEHWRRPLVLMSLQPVITPSQALPCAMIARRPYPGWINRGSYLAVSAALAGLSIAIGHRRAALVPAPRPAFWNLKTHLGRPLPRITALPAVFDQVRPTDFGPADHLVEYPPLVSPDPTLSAELDAFLEAGSPPVHLGLGSMPASELTHSLPSWLQAIEQAGLRALLPRSLAGRPPGSWRHHHVYEHAPHDVLFPRCRLVIHHGGAGTLDTASRAGVPQLILPQFLDQFWNAREASRIGLTPLVETGSVAVSRIETLLADALLDGRRERAREMGQRLAGRDRTGDIVRLIETSAATR